MKPRIKDIKALARSKIFDYALNKGPEHATFIPKVYLDILEVFHSLGIDLYPLHDYYDYEEEDN